MKDYKSVQDKIEMLVLKKKNLKPASIAVQNFYKHFSHRTDALFLCCNWYRRLGFYSKALKLLKINSQNLTITLSTASREGRKILWFSRLTNLLGGSTIAQKLIQNISPVGIEDHRIFGLIHLTNFCFHQAHSSFVKTTSSMKTYANRLDFLNLSDSLVGLKQFDEAIKINMDLLKHSESEYETALIHQATGEIYARQKDWEKAGAHLQKAERYFKTKPLNVDQAFLNKWLSVHSFHTGQTDKAKFFLEKSTNALVKLMIRDESLILNLDLYDEFGLFDQEKTAKLHLIKSFFGKEDFIENSDVSIGSDKASIKVNWRSKEVAIKSKGGFQYRFEMNKEIQFLLLLKIFEDWGINCYSVYDKLYQDDPFGIVHAKDRIRSLIQRLAKVYGVKVIIKGDRLTLSKASATKIQISNLDSFPRYRFLEEASSFQTKNVMQFYLISKTLAQQLIQRWLQEGLILKKDDLYVKIEINLSSISD
ncbi:MAG: tetratricopeptide repeat protein [Bdellovibrionales bacterium]|nr:tetratricopeptide repeat protein [Bdellovibrionales bacterium]